MMLLIASTLKGRRRLLIAGALTLFFTGCASKAQPEEAAPPDTAKAVAITVDDVPGVAMPPRIAENTDSVVAMNRRLVAHLGRFKAPATAFVVPGRACSEGACDRLDRVLDVWLSAGHDLANHTLTHRSLNRISTEEQIEDIDRASEILRSILHPHGKRLKYFRHPALHTGDTASKRDSVEAYLAQDGLQVGPVTIDNSEWIFASAYSRAMASNDTTLMRQIGREYIDYMGRVFAFYEEFSKRQFDRYIPQILLIHGNSLNAEYLDELLAEIRDRGYEFVSMDDAMQDSAYARGNPYVGPRGLSWLQRWRVADGRETLREPGYPGWINEQAGM